MYYVILRHIIPLFNRPENLENYVCKENETKILIPLHSTANAQFKGIKNTLDHVMLRGGKDDFFFTYGYEPSKLFCALSK